MLGKTSKPMFKILIGSITQHIETKNQSPRGRKKFDLGGVGLGIVAALDNYSRNGPTKIPANNAFFSRNLSRPKPIPENSSRVCEEVDTMDSFEEYSVVTCHGPKGSYSKVYPNVRKSHDDQKSIRVECSSSRSSVFHISPDKAFDFSGIRRTSDDFLSSCNMCQKKLLGKDIYMYRGEKAFCSTECRYKQIVLDDRRDREKYCSTEASRRSHVESAAANVSSSPYTNTEQIFTTSGILAS